VSVIMRVTLVTGVCHNEQPGDLEAGEGAHPKVPQSSILGSTLFSVYINNIFQAVGSSLIHLYGDDTVLFSAASPGFVLNAQQQSFLSVQ
jgi:hypothetical protein